MGTPCAPPTADNSSDTPRPGGGRPSDANSDSTPSPFPTAEKNFDSGDDPERPAEDVPKSASVAALEDVPEVTVNLEGGVAIAMLVIAAVAVVMRGAHRRRMESSSVAARTLRSLYRWQR
eukprot:3078343-Rhodomonas_salina.2